jgi:hypothetical protein
MDLSLTALALLVPEVVPPDMEWHNHVERLLLTAIAGLCATVALMFRVFLGQYGKAVNLVMKMGEMLGENSSILMKIPEHLQKQEDSIEQALHAFEVSVANCAATRDRLERAIADVSRE